MAIYGLDLKKAAAGVVSRKVWTYEGGRPGSGTEPDIHYMGEEAGVTLEAGEVRLELPDDIDACVTVVETDAAGAVIEPSWSTGWFVPPNPPPNLDLTQ